MFEKHQPVSDADFYNALPENGLALAKEQVQEYLDRAQQDDALPTKDAVIGLLTIEAIQAQRDGKQSA